MIGRLYQHGVSAVGLMQSFILAHSDEHLVCHAKIMAKLIIGQILAGEYVSFCDLQERVLDCMGLLSDKRQLILACAIYETMSDWRRLCD